MLTLALLDLTLREVLADIPRDADAIVAYVVLLLFLGFTLAGSRRSGTGSGGGSDG